MHAYPTGRTCSRLVETGWQVLTLAVASSAALGTEGRKGVGRELANWGVAPKELAEGPGVGLGLRSGPEGTLGLLESVKGGAKGVPAAQETVMPLAFACTIALLKHTETGIAIAPDILLCPTQAPPAIVLRDGPRQAGS